MKRSIVILVGLLALGFVVGVVLRMSEHSVFTASTQSSQLNQLKNHVPQNIEQQARWSLENCALIPVNFIDTLSPFAQEIFDSVLMQVEVDWQNNMQLLETIDEEIDFLLEEFVTIDSTGLAASHNSLDLLLHERRQLTVSHRELLEIALLEALAETDYDARREFVPFYAYRPGAIFSDTLVKCNGLYLSEKSQQ